MRGMGIEVKFYSVIACDSNVMYIRKFIFMIYLLINFKFFVRISLSHITSEFRRVPVILMVHLKV
jgi:hypothetical protein